MKFIKKIKRPLSAFLAALMIIPINIMPAFAVESQSIENETDFNISIEWEDSKFKNDSAYEIYETTPKSNTVKLRISYRNNEVCEEGYDAGELIIVVDGIGDVLRGGKLEAVVGADKESSSIKQRDWSYTYNKSNDTYTFINNKAIKPNSVLSGYFDMVWNIYSKDSVNGFTKENIKAELLLQDGNSVISNSLSFKNNTLCDTYNVDISVGSMYSYEGLINDIDNPDSYTFVKYILNSNEKSNSRTVNNYRFIFNPDKENVGNGAVVISDIENTLQTVDNKNGTYTVNMNKTTSNSNNYVFVAYPKEEYVNKTVNASLLMYGTYYEGDNDGNIEEKELAQDITDILINSDFDFIDPEGGVYDYWKDVSWDKVSSEEQEKINERGGDILGNKMVLGTTERFYLEGLFKKPIENNLLDEQNENIINSDIENIKLDDYIISTEYNYEESLFEENAETTNIANTISENSIGSLYTIEMVDDFLYITCNDGTYRQLEAGEYEFKSIIIPSATSLKNMNEIPLKANKYPVKIYAFENGEKVDLDNAEIYKETSLGATDKTVSLPQNTTAIAIIIDELDESIMEFSIPVDVKFHIDETKDDNLINGQVVNTTFIKLYKNGEWIWNNLTADNYIDDSNLGLAQKDLDIYGNYLNRERDHITFYNGEKSNYRATTHIGEIKYNGKSYVTPFSMGAKFDFKENEIPDKFSLYTIIPEGLDIYNYTQEEDIWNLFKFSGFGLSNDFLANHCIVEIDKNYKNSNRIYVAAHFDLSDLDVAQDGEIKVLFDTRVDKKLLKTSYSVSVNSLVLIDKEINEFLLGKVLDNGSWNSDIFKDIDNDGIIDEYLAKNSSSSSYIHVDSSQFEMSKSVKTSTTDEYVQLPDIPLTEEGEEYIYELSIRNGESVSKDIIIKDILETSSNSQWNGTFKSLDLSNAEKQGLEAVVYYSTKNNPGVSLNDNDWITKESWASIYGDDVSSVKAIAIDFGSSQLKSGAELNINIHMIAPIDENLRNKVTENNFSASFTMVDKSGNETITDELNSNPVQVKLSSKLKNIILTKIDEKNNARISNAKYSLINKDTGEIASSGITNSKGQIIFNKIPSDSIYILREDEAPEGYEIGPDQEIIFDENITLRTTVKEKRKLASAIVIKTNSLDDLLRVEGAEYTLFSINGEIIQTETTDINGKLTFKNIDWGEYYIQETKAPDGYKIDNNKYPLTINKGNVEKVQQFKLKNDQEGSTKAKLSKYAMTTTGVQTEIPVSGAVFQLVKVTGGQNNVIGVYVTDKNGEIIVEDLPYGDYLFRESRIPAGYQKVNNVEFNISPTNKNVDLIAYNKRNPGSIHIYKKDDMNNAVTGAVFELYDETQFNVLGTYTTDISGCIDINNLEWGTYYLREKSTPDCYILNQDWIEININEKNIKINKTLINQSKKGSIVLVKTDEIGKNKLEGAVFNLYKEDGSLIYKDLITDTNGEIKVNNLDWGKYYFKETKAPNGYSITDETIRFSVNRINAGMEQSIQVINPLNSKMITLTKKIYAKDINFDNGDPTFMFKLNGTDIHNEEHVYYRIVRFDKNYTEANIDSDGYVSQSVIISGLKEGIYTAIEENTSRYNLKDIIDISESGLLIGDSVKFDLDNNENGSATFVNKKYENQNFSDNQSLANVLKKKNKLTALKFNWLGGDEVEAKSEIDTDLMEVIAIYDDGTTEVLSDSQWNFGDTVSGIKFPNQNGDYQITVEYTENGITKTDTKYVIIYGAVREIIDLNVSVKDNNPLLVGSAITKDMFNVTALYNDNTEEILTEQDYIIDKTIVPEVDGMFEVTISLNHDKFEEEVSSIVNMLGKYPDPVLIKGSTFKSKIPSNATSVVFTDETVPGDVTLIDLSEAKNNSVVGWLDGEVWKVSTQRKGVKAIGNKDCEKMFYDCKSLIDIDFTFFDTSNVINMYGMFQGSGKLTKVDVSNFNTSNVTDMMSMFNGCSGLTELDVSNFNTDNVTSMTYMFNGCSGLTELDVSGFDTSNVNSMAYMFSRCSGLIELDVSGFDTSKVTNMLYMFEKCGKLKKVDVSNFDTSKVTNLSDMFYGCSGLTELDISNFDTSNVTNMSNMFNGCSGLTEFDISNLDTSNVTNMGNMFNGCKNLIKLDINNFNTSNVTNMSNMFSNCSTLIELDLTNFNTANVTNMANMFSGCGNLTELILTNFDTSNVTTMASMFNGCSKLTELDVSSFNTANVTNMSGMFAGCRNLSYIDVSNFNTSKVTNMSSMFNAINQNGGNRDPISLDLSSFDTSKVTHMGGMFFNSGRIESIEFGENFNTSNVTDMGSIFWNCSNLISADLSKWDTSKVTTLTPGNGYAAFMGCKNLTTEITIRGNITSYKGAFEGAATAANAVITLNYTESTSELVDALIATKSANSNVVKGRLVE